MVKFFLPVSSRDYFALDPRPLRAVKNTKVGGSGGRVPTRLRAQDAKVKRFITPSTYFRPRFARGEAPAPVPARPALRAAAAVTVPRAAPPSTHNTTPLGVPTAATSHQPLLYTYTYHLPLVSWELGVGSFELHGACLCFFFGVFLVVYLR